MRSFLRRLFGRIREVPMPAAPGGPAPVRPVASTLESPAALTRAYHRRTVHHAHRYARGPDFMDWDTQPDPFRRYEGAPLVPLTVSDAPGPRYEPAFVEGLLPAAPIDHAGISQLFTDSLALSAWKQAEGHRWSLRVNPSSGNLHPTEAWLVCGPVPGVTEVPAVFHYAPQLHALERRGLLPGDLPPGLLLIGLGSIPWRESWKYGERAFRYCQHDVGHAMAALAVAAAGLGWKARLLERPGDAEIAALLGLNEAGPEAEHPDLLLAIGPDRPAFLDPSGPLPAPPIAWSGTPNRLSPEHTTWAVIDEVAAATRKPATAPAEPAPRPPPAFEVGDSPLLLRTIVRQRRSAVAMDGRSGLHRADFEQILARVLPGAGQVPFASLPGPPEVDLLLFVHRVAGLDPGFYALVRTDRLERLRACMDPTFAWERLGALPLYRLRSGDARPSAIGTSCGQAIAGDGVFAATMLADLGGLERVGAWMYRLLHWECGMIGQQLYLEAEASGVRATGIGCFYDDESARAFGLRDPDLAVLYHFTVGGPVEDERLQTLAPYGHLGDEARGPLPS